MKSDSPEKQIFSDTPCLPEEVLMRYARGELSVSEQHEAEKHLVDCELCSDALEGFLLLKNTQSITTIRETISLKYSTPEKNNSRKFWLAAASIALLLSLGITTWYFTSNKEPGKEIALLETLPEQQIPPELKNADPQPEASPIPPAENKLEAPAKEQRNNFSKANSISGAVHSVVKKELITKDKQTLSSDDAAPSESRVETPSPEMIKHTVQVPIAENPPMQDVVVNTTSESFSLASGADVVQNKEGDNYKPIDLKNSETVAVRSTSKKSKDLAAERLSGVNPQSQDDKLSEGKKLFSQKKYTEATAFFSTKLNDPSTREESVFYLGKCFYFRSMSDSAIGRFNESKTSPNQAIHDESEWYLALCHLQNNDREKAKLLLQKLANGKGKFRSQAKEKLIELK